MDYAMIPPEITSTQMHSGPGSGSIMAAAASWDGVAAELHSTAEAFERILSTLTSWEWLGPASAAMRAAATTFIEWLTSTAARALQTATQARAAAAAFELAFGMIVSPAVIAANRALLRLLIATNFFGQNSAAIAATEAVYAEYWAQDATAMYSYAAGSATATKLTPFNAPQQSTDPSAQGAQDAAVSNAAFNPIGAIQSLLNQLGSQVSQLGSQVSQALDLPSFQGIIFDGLIPDDFTVLDEILLTNTAISSTENLFSVVSSDVGVLDTFGMITPVASVAPAAAETLGGGLAPVLTSLNGINGALSASGVSGGGAVLASSGQAQMLGRLSVPQGWSLPAGGNTLVSALSPNGLTTLPAGETVKPVAAGAPGIPGMPTMTGTSRGGVVPRYGTRLTVMARPPAGG